MPPYLKSINFLLYIVSTPIGNLEDITKRALSCLQECDAILCEDTRRTSILLERHGIKKKLISYHQFKEKQSLEAILTDLESGRTLALVSDAGTPCINDPGRILAEGCIERGLPFTAIPGPCSVIQALVLSGFDTARFQFLGFLPKKPETVLRQALCYPGTTAAFESPQRLADTLESIGKIDPARKLAVAREMTKTFEECRRGTASELQAHYTSHPPRGEIVLLISGGELPPEDLPLEELIHLLQELHGLSLKEAIKQAARFKNLPKREVYDQIHKHKNL